MVTNFPGWTDQTVADESILNVSSVISDTGDILLGLDKSKHKLLVCVEDGSGLIVNHIYLCPADPTQPLIDISDVNAHTHTSDADGGKYYDVIRANPLFRSLLILPPHLHKADWEQSIGTGGALADDIDGTTKEKSIKTTTGATNATVVTHNITSLKLDFAKRSKFQTKVKFGTASSIAFCTGVNADSLTVSPTNTQKYCLEMCSTVNLNWFARSADGSAPVAEDTGIAITTNQIAIKIEHFPDLATKKIDFYFGNTVWSKTTRIPNSSTTAADNLLKHTLKTNTGGDRSSFNYGCRLDYHISDVWQ